MTDVRGKRKENKSRGIVTGFWDYMNIKVNEILVTSIVL